MCRCTSGTGDVVGELLAEEARERDAVALVIGTRGRPGGASPAGHVALDLVQSLDRPIVVVPPNAADRPLRRVLVAVEGDGESPALRGVFDRLGDRPTPEVIALHVLEPDDLPMFADSSGTRSGSVRARVRHAGRERCRRRHFACATRDESRRRAGRPP